MTREDFLTIYGGIQYWLSQYRVEKVSLLQRMLFEVTLNSMQAMAMREEGQTSNAETDAVEQNLELQMQQTKAAVFVPDIDDIPDEDSLVVPTDIEPFIPKDAIGNTDPVTYDDLMCITLDVFVMALLLNDPDDIQLASRQLSALAEPASPDLLPRYIACRAYMEYQKRKPKLALEKFQQSLELAPEAAETYMLRSLLYFNESKLDLALADIERAEMLKKNDVFIQSLHGDILFEKTDVAQSLKLHKGVIEKCPMLRRSLLSLGVIYLEMGEPDKSYPYLSTILRNEPLNWFALSCLGDIFLSQVGQTFRAIPCYTLAILSGATEPLVYLNLLKLLIYGGKYEEALSIIRDFKSHKYSSNTPPRFKPVPQISRFEEDINFLKIICEIVTSPLDPSNTPEQLPKKLAGIQADEIIRLLFLHLQSLVTLSYEDDIQVTCERSLTGIKTLEAYARSWRDRIATHGEIVLITAIIRMAIWNGFQVEARSFLNLLSQAQDASLRDAVSMLENEFFEHEACARTARVDTTTLHVQIISQQSDSIISFSNSKKGKNSDKSSKWRVWTAGAMGLRTHDDWQEILFSPQENAPYLNILKFCQNTMFSHIAPRIRDSIAYLSKHLSEPFEASLPAVRDIILKGRVFSDQSPETKAIIEYLEYWFRHETQQHTIQYNTSDFCASLRFSKNCESIFNDLEYPVHWDADNDDTIDTNALKAEHFVTTMRPRYFDDTSFKQGYSVWDFPIFELSPTSLDPFLKMLAEDYGVMYERAQTNAKLNVAAIKDKYTKDNTFTDALRMIHGQACPEVFKALHLDNTVFPKVIQIFSQIDPNDNLNEFRMALESWRPKDAEYHLLPKEPFPSQYAFIRIQTPPNKPLANHLLQRPIPGNLITWHDLKEMFHNYAVWAIEEALEHDNLKALESFWDHEIDFTFYDFVNPHKVLETPQDMLKALSVCKAQSIHQPPFQRIIIQFGNGTSQHPFYHQFDAWAEYLATRFLPECIRIEHSVYHVNLQRSFETRCRIQSILNRYPFLSRLYILQAAMFVRLKDTASALKSIQTGLEWEDKLYAGVGWNPIHPDPEHPEKELPLEICNTNLDGDYPYALWQEERLELNQENDLSYYFSPWNSRFRMRTRKPYQLPVTIHREMNFDKAGAYDFYRLFANFIKEIPHIAQVYLHAVATPCLWGLSEYIRYAIHALESDQSFEFHRQLAELLLQIYPFEDEMIPARFCCDNGFSINAMHHAAMSLVCRTLSGTHHDAYEACEVIGASLYDLGYIQEATPFLKIAVSAPNHSAQAHLTYGCACIENRHFKTAITQLTEGMQLDKYNDRFYFNLALAYIESQEFDKAESVLRQGLEIARAPYDLGVQLLRVLVKTERIHEAVDLAKLLNKADHDAFVETMLSIEFTQFSSLNPVRTLLDENW